MEELGLIIIRNWPNPRAACQSEEAGVTASGKTLLRERARGWGSGTRVPTTRPRPSALWPSVRSLVEAIGCRQLVGRSRVWGEQTGADTVGIRTVRVPGGCVAGAVETLAIAVLWVTCPADPQFPLWEGLGPG